MKNILVPTDFSPNSMKALKFALNLALEQQAKLVVIHQTSVLELVPDSTFAGIYMPAPKDQIEFLQNELNKFIRKAKTALKGKADKVQIQAEIQPGVGTSDVLSICIKKEKIDLLIMGTTGASGLKRLFLGSIAAQMIEKSTVPVLVIPNNFRQKKLSNLGFACDLKHVNKEMEILAPLAQSLGSSIELFHIEPSFPANPDFNTFNPDEVIPVMKKKFKLDSLSYKLIKTRQDNDFFGGIEKYRKTAKPDVICTVTHRRSWLGRIIDTSKSKSLAYHNEIPVLCIKVAH